MKNQLLLIEDVDGLGRSGDIATAKPGFVRNFLIPKGKAVFADKHTLKMQAKLKEEREKKAQIDRKESEELAKKMEGLTIQTKVKVDPEGNMYGSVTPYDMTDLLVKRGFAIERRFVLSQPIKSIGSHTISLRLKENVMVTFVLDVIPEGELKVPEKK